MKVKEELVEVDLEAVVVVGDRLVLVENLVPAVAQVAVAPAVVQVAAGAQVVVQNHHG